jgi:hypothetical protein
MAFPTGSDGLGRRHWQSILKVDAKCGSVPVWTWNDLGPSA